VEKLFVLFEDSARRGSLRMAEFALGMACFVACARDDRQRFCFTAFDTNKDGNINKAELVGILRGNLLAGSDREVQRKADTAFEQADANKDGFIDYADFARVAQRFPKILFPYGTTASSSPPKAGAPP